MVRSDLQDKLNALRSFAWVTHRGRFIAKIESETCYENPTVLPMHIAALMSGYMYHGCGIWKDINGEEFRYRNINKKWGGYNVLGTIDGLLLIPVGKRKEEGKIDLHSIEDIMNDDAVITITSDGWKIVDMYAFKSVPWDMTGFHTYAFNNGVIKKCIIGYNNDITYTIF